MASGSSVLGGQGGSKEVRTSVVGPWQWRQRRDGSGPEGPKAVLVEGRRKRAKASRDDGNGTLAAGGGPDRLSALPDCLLHAIMSLKFREAVRTCVLSKRWRHLWRSMPCLDIDYKELFNTKVAAAAAAGAASVLQTEYRLYLCNVFLDNLFAEHVGSVCRSLQDLELDGCTCNKIWAITSHSMKSLVLKNCRWRGEHAEITSPTLISNTGTGLLVILAPAVDYLHLHVDALQFAGGISIHEMPSLDKASIHIKCRYNRILYTSKIDVNHLNLIRSLSNVTSLELSGLRTKVFSKKPTFQEFKNLRNLLLGNCGISDHTLGFFLNSSPNLEKLTLRHCKTEEETPKLNECSGLDFHHENLKLEIIYKQDDAGAFRLIGFLLHFFGNLSKDFMKFTK
ncbi:hypothetical protein U9M48_001869, partial [Paspalum notatum var. saurae]